MKRYKHVSGHIATELSTCYILEDRFVGTDGYIPKEIVEKGSDWTRMLSEVKEYPARLVEPLLNCRMENTDKYIDALIEYKKQIQES